MIKFKFISLKDLGEVNVCMYIEAWALTFYDKLFHFRLLKLNTRGKPWLKTK